MSTLPDTLASEKALVAYIEGKALNVLEAYNPAAEGPLSRSVCARTALTQGRGCCCCCACCCRFLSWHGLYSAFSDEKCAVRLWKRRSVSVREGRCTCGDVFSSIAQVPSKQRGGFFFGLQ